MPAPLILLPGLICDARLFSAQTEKFRCLVVDGFGPRSDFGDMARHVLDIAPPRMSLLGHSMGARVAMEVWRSAPERIERLALFSTGSHLVRPGEAEKRFALRDVGRRQGMAALVDQWLPPMVAPGHRDGVQYPVLRRMCIEAGLATFEAQITALLNRPEVETLLQTITCPTLVGTGELDLWSPPDQLRTVAKFIRGAELRIFPGAGHMLPAEEPEAFNAAISTWLASGGG